MGEDAAMARRRRRIWLVVAGLVVLGPAGWYAQEVLTRTGAERVRHMVDWGSCAEIELTRKTGRLPEYARDWRDAEERAMVICHYLGGSVVYARFAGADASSRAVAASPPLWRVCDPVEEAVATVDGYDRARGGAAFRERCARRRGELSEETERYCLAGDEVVVDGLDDDPEFRELCDDLDGSLERAPRSVLDR